MFFSAKYTYLPSYLPTYLPTYIYARENASKFVNMSNPVQLSSKKMKEYQAALPEGFHEENENKKCSRTNFGLNLPPPPPPTPPPRPPYFLLFFY